MRSDLRSIIGPTAPEVQPASRRARIGNQPMLVALAVLCLGLMLSVGLAIGQLGKGDAPSGGVPQQIIGPKAVVVRDYPDQKWLTYYEEHASLLGDPQWSERPYDIWSACMGFTNYVVCHDPSRSVNGTAWEFQPLLLGTKSLPRDVGPNARAELAPAVQAYLSQLQEHNDPWYWLGAVQTTALCPVGTGTCYQTFQRQVLTWPNGSASADAVHLSPLGLAIQPATP
jgi:hypothetical protein